MFEFKSLGQAEAIAINKFVAADEKAWRLTLDWKGIEAALGVSADVMKAGWIGEAIDEWKQIGFFADGKGNTEINSARQNRPAHDPAAFQQDRHPVGEIHATSAVRGIVGSFLLS